MGGMTTSSDTSTSRDGLEVRCFGDGFAVFDTLTQKFVSSKRTSAYWLKINLQEHRQNFRPIIVRWIYGCSIDESKALGVTTDA